MRVIDENNILKVLMLFGDGLLFLFGFFELGRNFFKGEVGMSFEISF